MPCLAADKEQVHEDKDLELVEDEESEEVPNRAEAKVEVKVEGLDTQLYVPAQIAEKKFPIHLELLAIV